MASVPNTLRSRYRLKCCVRSSANPGLTSRGRAKTRPNRLRKKPASNALTCAVARRRVIAMKANSTALVAISAGACNTPRTGSAGAGGATTVFDAAVDAIGMGPLYPRQSRGPPTTCAGYNGATVRHRVHRWGNDVHLKIFAGLILLAYGMQMLAAPMPVAKDKPSVPTAPPRNEGEGPYSQLILRGVTVIDGTGSPAYGPADVVIEGNRIVSVKSVGNPGAPIDASKRPKLAAGGKEMDLSGYYV